MAEKFKIRHKVAKYDSLPFKGLTPEILTRAETIKGKYFSELLSSLEESIKSSKEHPYINAVLAYEVTKATLEKKNLENIDGPDVITALSLCINLATEVYHGKKHSSLKALKKYRDFMGENSTFKDIVDRRIRERPDYGAASAKTQEEDADVTRKLLKDTGGAPVFAIIGCHRGFRRGLDIFSRYKYESNTPNSACYPVRIDNAHGIQVGEKEREYIRRQAEGKKLVVIVPDDRFASLGQDEQTRALNGVFRFTRKYNASEMFGTLTERARVIYVRIPLVEKK